LKAGFVAPVPLSNAAAGFWHTLLAAGVALPWLVPFTPGPVSAMVQSLSSSLGLLLVALGFSAAGFRADPLQSVRTLALAWLSAALLSSGIALLQYAGIGHFAAPWVAAADLGEAYANLRQRNQFATLTSIGLIALAYLAPRGLWLWAALLLLGAANAASTSRTGAVQWLVLAVLVTWWSRTSDPRGSRTSAAIVWQGLAVYGLFVVALARLLQAITGQSYTGLLDRLAVHPGCESRMTLWANVLELIGESPWAGWGWGGLKLAHFMQPYSGERFCALLDNAHNLPLHLAVELGVPLAAALLGGAAWWVWRAAPWAEVCRQRRMAWSILAVIAVHSLLEYPLWYGPFQVAALLAIALLCKPRPVLRMPLAGVASVAFAVWLWMAWDYVRVTQLYLEPGDRLALLRDNTMDKVRGIHFFQPELQFAEVTTTPLTAENAAQLHQQAVTLLRFSPEPRVVVIALNAALLLGLDDPATRQLRARFAAVYPAEFAQWRADCASCPP